MAQTNGADAIMTLYIIAISVLYLLIHVHNYYIIVVPQSDIELRLVPPEPGLNFLGRLEVLYNDTWGTVCDDFFGYIEADIVCHMLNFTRGALCVAGNAKFGQGQGRSVLLPMYR